MSQATKEKSSCSAELLKNVNSSLFDRVHQRLLTFYPEESRTAAEKAVVQTLPERLWLVRRMSGVDQSAYPDFAYQLIFRYSLEFNHDERFTSSTSPTDRTVATYIDRWNPTPYQLELPELHQKHVLELGMVAIGLKYFSNEALWRAHGYIETDTELKKLGIGSFLFGLRIKLRELIAPGDTTSKIHHELTDNSEGSWTTRQVHRHTPIRTNLTVMGPRTFLIREE